MSLPDARWQLYRLLAEPLRLRIMALAVVEELSVGELAELLGESQPNVSRHAAHLRQAGLLLDRREGTRLYVHVPEFAERDPVVLDALAAGKELCRDDGSLARIDTVIQARDAHTREFFSDPHRAVQPQGLAPELPAYLHALAGLITPHDLAVDAGTGEGAWLDVLAPVFRRVIALDRSEAQLGRAQERIRARGYDNVEVLRDEVTGARVRQAVAPGADLVVCSRVLHHAPRPRETLWALTQLARPGGSVVVLDYQAHHDERLSEQQADVWMGFKQQELEGFAEGAGLVDRRAAPIPPCYVHGAVDAHVGWQVLIARRPEQANRT